MFPSWIIIGRCSYIYIIIIIIIIIIVYYVFILCFAVLLVFVGFNSE